MTATRGKEPSASAPIGVRRLLRHISCATFQVFFCFLLNVNRCQSAHVLCLLVVESQVAEAAAVRDQSGSRKKSALFEGLTVLCRLS